MKSRKEKLLKPGASREGAARLLYSLLNNTPAKPLGFAGLVFAVIFVLLTCTAVKASNAPPKVLLIPIHGDIDRGLSFFVQRMLRRAQIENVPVILEINSNGGLITAAQEIKDALLESEVTTIAYVRRRALSAAALIAISCHRIYMEPGSEIGAATPVMLAGPGIAAAEEKFVSAFKAEFRASAEARQRPVAIAEAMVDKNHDGIEGIVKRGEIVTLTTEEAFEHGYCDHIVSSLSTIQRVAKLESAVIEKVEPTFFEAIARFLTSPSVSVLIFTLGFWCLAIEMFITGFGVLGYIGVVLLALFFGGHLFAYLAGLEVLLVFGIGITLMLVELLVLPGFGLAGIGGILSMCFGLVLIFGGIYETMYAIAAMMTYSLFILMGLYYWAPKLKIVRMFVLENTMETNEGYVATNQNAYDHLSGLEGIALTQCRPSGKALIGDDRYDVVSDGSFIEKDTRIIVKKVQGTKIIIKELSE